MKRPILRRGAWSSWTLLVLAGLSLPSMGCWQSMGYQPSYRPLTESEFFPDGRSSRPLEPGTVARRSLYVDDPQLDSGLKPDVTDEIKGKARYFVDFPFKLDDANLKRGQERFNIYCSVCHDRLGTGHGIVPQRGFTPPPNLLTDESRGLKYQGEKIELTKVPPGYIFEVITHGYGAMPSHGAQVPPLDRWYIIGYVRSLQEWWKQLPKEEQERILKSMPPTTGGTK